MMVALLMAFAMDEARNAQQAATSPQPAPAIGVDRKEALAQLAGTEALQANGDLNTNPDRAPSAALVYA